MRVFAVLVFGIPVVFSALDLPFPLPPILPGLPEQHVGSEACSPCHAILFEKYRTVSMSRSLYRPSREASPEFFSSSSTFVHAKSGYRYEMSERGGKFYQKRFLLDSRGQTTRVREEEISYVVGSGNHARTYLRHHADGRITQLPVSWYGESGSWGMSPGYDELWHPDFSREVRHDCVFCHASYPRLVPATSSNEKLFPYELQMAIGCERCHGPGAAHVNAARSGADSGQIQTSIFNPRKATKRLQRDLCYQCHLASGTHFARDRIYRPERPVFSYLPGSPLSSTVVNLDYSDAARPADEFKIAHQAYRLEQSPCFQASNGEMRCTSCHDPHETPAPAEKAQFFRRKCLQCHPKEAHERKLPGGARHGGDCASCHMRKRNPEDAVLTIFTDHKIQRPGPGFASRTRGNRPKLAGEPQEELVVYKSQEISPLEEHYFLGMAYLQPPPERTTPPNASQRQRGIRLLQEFLRKAEGSPNGQYVAYSSRAYYVLAESYRQGGQLELASEAYRKSIAYDSAFADAYVNTGALLAELDRPTEALQSLSKALTLHPKDAMAHRNLGSLFAWQGDIPQAIRFFEQSLSIDPDNVGALHYLGKALALARNYGDAVSAYEKALDKEPRSSEVYWDCAEVLLAQGKREKALLHIRTGLRYSPRHPRGLQLLSSATQQPAK